MKPEKLRCLVQGTFCIKMRTCFVTIDMRLMEQLFSTLWFEPKPERRCYDSVRTCMLNVTNFPTHCLMLASKCHHYHKPLRFTLSEVSEWIIQSPTLPNSTRVGNSILRGKTMWSLTFILYSETFAKANGDQIPLPLMPDIQRECLLERKTNHSWLGYYFK